MKRENIIEKSLIILSFILLLLVIVYTPTINKYRNNGKLIINEVMPNNKYTIKDTYGLYSDYIEFINIINEKPFIIRSKMQLHSNYLVVTKHCND